MLACRLVLLVLALQSVCVPAAMSQDQPPPRIGEAEEIMPVRQDAALAQARRQLGQAELLLQQGRAQAANGVIDAAVISLSNLPSGTQRDDLLAQATVLRQRLVDMVERSEDAAGRRRRESSQAAAVQARDEGVLQEISLLQARIARIRALQASGFYESALAEARQLITDFPLPAEPRALFSELLTQSHDQRHLSLEERRQEQLQEVHEQLARSMIPTGSDGFPIYPVDWAERHRGSELPAIRFVVAEEPTIRERLRQRITLTVADLPLWDVLAALAAQTSLNILLDKRGVGDEQARVTLSARDITLEHALSWICRQADVRWSVTQGAIYVGRAEAVAPELRIHDVTDLVLKPQDQHPGRIGLPPNRGDGKVLFAGGMATDPTYVVAPEDLVDQIQQGISPAVWRNPLHGIVIRGTLLIVTAPPEVHELIAQLLHSMSRLNRLTVSMEVDWLAIADGYLEEIGVEWGRGTVLNGGPANGFHRATAAFDHQGTLTNNLPAAAIDAAPATIGTGLSLNTLLLSATQLSATLTARERNQRVTVLNGIQVATLNGVRATCRFGQEIAYLGDIRVGTGGPNALSPPAATDTAVVVLGHVLDIKPYVSADHKYITLEIGSAMVDLVDFRSESIQMQTTRPLPNVPGAGGNGQPLPAVGQVATQGISLEMPSIALTEVHTNVMLPDRGTIMVGGFGRIVDQTMTSTVPMLGHIPFLGRLFGARGRYSDRRRLYCTVTATIIDYVELEGRL